MEKSQRDRILNRMSPDERVLEARQIGRRVADGPWLLAEVSLRLAAGSRAAVTGPSGSGKTLLLRALALLDPLDSGEGLEP